MAAKSLPSSTTSAKYVLTAKKMSEQTLQRLLDKNRKNQHWKGTRLYDLEAATADDLENCLAYILYLQL